MNQLTQTSIPRFRPWLAALAARTRAFEILDSTPEGLSDEVHPWDEAVSILPTGSQEPLRLLVDLKLRLHPQHALAAVARLKTYPDLVPGNVLAVVAAPYISPRAAEICREHGVGYLDAAGNCHLAGPGLSLHVEGRPNATPDTRPAENLFAPKSSRVVRILVEHPARGWGVQELAREARVSIGLVSRVKHKLIEQAFAEETPSGLCARDPTALLEAWAAVYKNTARAVSVYSMDEAGILERIAGWCADHSARYALAEFSAAARLSPMVRHKRAAVYIEESRSRDVLGSLMRELDLKEVDSGASAVLWVTEDDAVFYNSTERDGLMTVSPVQVYLDLTKNPARGREAADEVLRRLILPRFQSGRTVIP